MARSRLMILRVFSKVITRFLAAIFFACVLSWVGISPAHAAFSNTCQFATNNCTQEQAYAIASNGVGMCASTSEKFFIRWFTSPTFTGTGYRSQPQCGVSGGSTYIYTIETRFTQGCPASTPFNPSTGRCQESCSKAEPYTGRGPWSSLDGAARNGSLGCRSGCDGIWYLNADDTHTWNATGGQCAVDEKGQCAQMTGYYWNYVLSVCEPVDVECMEGLVKKGGKCVEACPAGMVVQIDGTCKNKENECPQGNIKAPSGQCLAGDGQCAAGEAKGKDGSCKRDADGDGKPDAGEDEGTTDETFSGGDSCNSPPSCSGSPIMCGQARIQWRIDCNTRKNRNVSGGACSTMPVCTGEKCDAVEYSGLLMQWRTACAVEKLAGKGNDDGDGSQPDWTKVGGMNQNPGSGELSSDKPTIGEKEFNTDDLDSSGFGGGSCVGLASVSGQGVVGSSYAQTFASPPAAWCNFISNLRASLIIISSALACFIIARGL